MSTNYDSYAIYYKTTAGGSYTFYDNSSSSTPALSSLTPNTNYYIRLLPYSATSGLYGDAVDISTTTLGKLSTFTSGTVNQYDISINWGGYYSFVNVYYGSTSGTYTGNTISYASSVKISSLSLNTQYYFNVVPYNSLGVSGDYYGELSTSTATDDFLSTSKMTYASSVRLLVSTYTGPVFTVRRDSDNTTSDFYTDLTQSYLTTGSGGTGTSYSSWIGSSTGYITTWYDQSGKGNHAYNNTAGSTQPKLALVKSKYVVQWTNGTVYTTLGTILYLPSPIKPYTIFCQFYNTNTNHGIILAPNHGTYPVDNSVRFGSGTNSGENVYGDSNINDWYYSSGGTKLSYVNNSSSTTVSRNTWNVLSLSSSSPYYAYDSSFSAIGCNPSTGGDGTTGAYYDRSIDGYMTEMVCHNTSMGETNMKAFYSYRLF